MKHHILKPALLGTAFFAISVFAVGNAARAEGTDQESINRFTVQVQSVESRDSGKVLTTELGLAKAWLGEAQAQLTQEEEEGLARTTKRIAAVVNLMNAKLAKLADEQKAAAARKAAAAAQGSLAKTRAEVAALNQQLTALSKKLEK